MKLRRLLALLFAIAASVWAGACASAGGMPVPRPFPGASAPPGPRRAPTGSAIVDQALRFLGAPYREGGDSPAGFDCSGFTRYVFALGQIALPRLTHEQARAGQALSLKKRKPGDLVFFTTIAPGASHVGIVVDRDRFVHAPTSSGVVRIESLSAPYWRSRLVGLRRVP